jgi:glycine/D-amino acid oxidase-like deaminating enzyme
MQRTSASQGDPSVMIIEQDPSYKSCSAVYSAGGIRIQFSLKENVLMSLYGVDFLRNCCRLLQTSSSYETEEVDVQYVENGYLMLASSQSGKQQLEDNFALYQQIGCEDMIQLMQPRELAQMFPWINTNDLILGSFGRSGEGWFDPWSLLRSFQKKNKELGVQYKCGKVVGAVRDPQTSELMSVCIQSPDGRLQSIGANTVVNAAGARAGQVMDILAGGIESPLNYPLPVHPKKRSVYFFHCGSNQKSNHDFKELIVPRIAPLTIDSSGAYFRSEGVVPGNGFFLCGVSPPEEQDDDCWDPDELANADPFLFETQIWPAIAFRVPAFNCIKLVSSWAGLYEVNVFDHNCILDFHPELQNVLMVNGFSGHGLQHSPAAGRAAAELIDNHNRYSTINLDIFRFDRLLQGGVPVLEKGIY